jgi:phosphate transport system protein
MELDRSSNLALPRPLSLDHVAYELERIGDSIANVAKRVRDVAPYPAIAEYVGIPEMGRLAARILGDVGRALVDSDVGAARAVASQDDAIDAHYHRAVDELIRQGQADPANVERAARLLIAAHYMERIGDRVTNIAEDVVFLSTGEHEDLNP